MSIVFDLSFVSNGVADLLIGVAELFLTTSTE